MRIASFAVLVALSTVAVASCSKDVTVDDLEKTVATELNASYADIGRKVSNVRCPDQMAKPEDGKIYTCTAELDGHDVRVAVEMNGGSVASIRSLDAVYDLGKLAKDLADSLGEQAGHPVSVNCGEGLKVIPAGEKFTCEKVNPDGAKSTVEITAKITEGPK